MPHTFSKGNLNHITNAGLFSLHWYVTDQFIWLLQSITTLLFFSTNSSIHHIFPSSIFPVSLVLLILCHLHPSLLSQLSAYIVFALAENSHFAPGENCVFLCSTHLSFFSCMFSTLAKLPLPACSRECASSRLSQKGPYSVMLQSPHPAESPLNSFFLDALFCLSQ